MPPNTPTRAATGRLSRCVRSSAMPIGCVTYVSCKLRPDHRRNRRSGSSDISPYFRSAGRIGQHTETIMPGAFAAALRRRAIARDVDHVGPAIARTSDGSLSLCEDGAGLLARVDLRAVDGTVARRLLEQAHRGELRGSFGFAEENSHVEYSRPPVAERLLRSVDLLSVSIVTGQRRSAAYRTTWLAVDGPETQQRIRRLNDEVRARRLVEAQVA